MPIATRSTGRSVDSIKPRLPTSSQTSRAGQTLCLPKTYIRHALFAVEKLDVEKIECALGDIIPLHDIKLNEYLTLAQLDEAVHRLYGYCCPSLSKMVWTGAMSSCFLYFFDGYVFLETPLN